MAKRKTLKKAVNMMCTDLLIELIGAQNSATGAAEQDVENIAESILLMRNDFVKRLSHVDKKQVKRFFNQMEEDLSTSTNDIIDQICHLI